MALTLELETLFLEVLNKSYIYLITSKVCFVKGLTNSTMTYVPNMIHICPNRLNVDPRCPPKKQKSCRSSNIHVKAVRKEMDKLKEARAMKEVYYPKWLVNTVVVKKKKRGSGEYV